jgi:hypothetical protein
LNCTILSCLLFFADTASDSSPRLTSVAAELHSDHSRRALGTPPANPKLACWCVSIPPFSALGIISPTLHAHATPLLPSRRVFSLFPFLRMPARMQFRICPDPLPPPSLSLPQLASSCCPVTCIAQSPPPCIFGARARRQLGIAAPEHVSREKKIMAQLSPLHRPRPASRKLTAMAAQSPRPNWSTRPQPGPPSFATASRPAPGKKRLPCSPSCSSLVPSDRLFPFRLIESNRVSSTATSSTPLFSLRPSRLFLIFYFGIFFKSHRPCPSNVDWPILCALLPRPTDGDQRRSCSLLHLPT